MSTTVTVTPSLAPRAPCCEYPNARTNSSGQFECDTCWQPFAANLVNLTPHAIVIAVGEHRMTVPPSGQVARVTQNPTRSLGVQAMGPETGLLVPIIAAPEFGPVEGLPAPVVGTILIVSGLVLAHCGGRLDVFAPATGPADGAIRDDAGRIAAVTRLVAAGARCGDMR